MFNPFSRVRLMLRENADDLEESTRVVVRQRTGWVMLLAAYLALLCLPGHRAFISDQATRALARKLPGWMTAAMGKPSAAQKPLSATAQGNPGERDLQLGVVHLGATPAQMALGMTVPAAVGGFADPLVQATDTVRTRFPNDPVPIAHVLRLCWVGGAGLGRGKPDAPASTPHLLPSDLARMEALCREGARLDPENGYFPMMLAMVQFKRRQDLEALESLHAASVCRDWDDYAFHQGAGARDLLIRTFGDRGTMMHALASASVLLPHLNPIRQSGQLAVEAAVRARVSGDFQLEHRTRMDVIRLGSLIRRNSEMLIGRLVGAAVQDLGFGGTPQLEWRAFRKSEQKAAEVRSAYSARVLQEAPTFSAEVKHELDALNQFLVAKRRTTGATTPLKMWDQLILTDVQRDAWGMTLLPNVAVSVLCWLLASIAVVAFRPRALSSVEAHVRLRAWSPRSIVLALCFSGAVCTAAARSVNLGHCWSSMLPAFWLLGGDQQDQPVPTMGFLLCTGALAAVMIQVSILAISAVRRRTFREMLDGSRLAFKSAAAISAGLYLVYVLVAVPATARDAQAWEKNIAQEMQGRPF